MNTIVIQSSQDIYIPVVELFKHIASRDLLTVFHNIPFVQRFAPIDQSQINRSLGSESIIFFEDCNSARHVFLTFINDWSFSVRIDNFTSMRLSPISAVEYQFTFFDNGDKSSIVSATYQFQMRSKIEMLLFKMLAGKFIQKHIDIFFKRIIQSSDQYKIVTDWNY